MKLNFLTIFTYTSLFTIHKFLILILLSSFYFLNYSSSTSVTLGIDWGEEFVEASIAFRGHRPDILLTGTGSRKFENAVYLLGDTRLFDKEASSFAVKDPSRTIQKSAHLLGIPFTSTSKWTRMSNLKASEVVETFKKNNVSFHWDYTPYEFGVSKDGQLHLKLLKDSMVGLEEATGHFFDHLKNVALDKLLSVKVIDSLDSKVEMLAVISIPCNYTQNQRKALVFAAESAGLKVVDLVHGVTAAAWFNTLEMPPGTRKVLYFDLGSSGANVGVVEAKVPQPNSKEHPQIKTLSCVTYPGVGGRQHDLLLSEYLREKFESENNLKLMPGNPKSLQKLLKNANKAKMKLSISENVFVEVDNLVKNKRLEVKLTRSEYEKILEPVLEKLHIPLKEALDKANLGFGDLDNIEMIGGAWRVPSVTKKLSDLVKPLQLGFHLNAEESIAMGCGYLAAAHNPFFVMKKVDLSDNSVYDYVLNVKGPDLDKTVTLYKCSDRLNTPKIVKVNTSNNFNLTLFETVSASDLDKKDDKNKKNEYFKDDNFPYSYKVLDYRIQGVDNLLVGQRDDKMAQVSLSFKTENGVIRLHKVTAKTVKKTSEKKLNTTKYDLSKSKQTHESLKDLAKLAKERRKDIGRMEARERASFEASKEYDHDGSVKLKNDGNDSGYDSDKSVDDKGVSDKGDNVDLLKDKDLNNPNYLKENKSKTPKYDFTGIVPETDKETTQDYLKHHPEETVLGTYEDHYVDEQTNLEGQEDDQTTHDDTVQLDSGVDSDGTTATSTTTTTDDNVNQTKDTSKDTSKESQKTPKKDKDKKESLKDKLLNKLNEDQVELEFVDNTQNLYHVKKLDETRKNIELLVDRDKAAIERSTLKNRLESTLYKYRSVLKTDDFKVACKPNEAEELGQKVKTLLDWFDSESHHASSDTLNKHLDDLNALGTPIQQRMNNNLTREALVKTANEEFEQMKQRMNQLLKDKPFLENQVSSLELFRNSINWWDKVSNEQKSRPLSEDSLFDSESINGKLETCRLILKNFENLKQTEQLYYKHSDDEDSPAPPPPPLDEPESIQPPPQQKQPLESNEESSKHVDL